MGDLVIYMSHKNLQKVEHLLQLAVNKVIGWCDKNGFKMSDGKTKLVHYRRLYKNVGSPCIYMNGILIPCENSHKFLGLIFDKKLNWNEHISDLVTQCKKRINIIKMLANRDWGSDRGTLLTLYKTLIRSKIDYGSAVYSSARTTQLKKLDVIQNLAIRISIGAFKSSPILSLEVESGVQSLNNRRMYMITKSAMEVLNKKYHPIQQNPTHIELSYRDKSTKPMMVRTKPICDKLEIIMKKSTFNYIDGISIAPWTLKKPHIIYDLKKWKKNETNNTTIIKDFFRILHNFYDFDLVYTDGSKTVNKVGCAYVYRDHIHKFRLPKECSIYTAELYAIWKFLTNIEFNSKPCIIFTDSLSSLQSIGNIYGTNQMVREILNYVNIFGYDKIVFCWVPSHVGIPGNEKADSAATSIRQTQSLEDFGSPITDIKKFIKIKIRELWRIEWTELCPNSNKLREVTDQIMDHTYDRLNRRDSSVITRIKIGHSRLTHGHLMNKSNQPFCNICNTPITLKHLLTICTDFKELRRQFEMTGNLRELFLNKKDSIIDIINFLKYAGLYDKI